jgi:hypothetical protein
VVSHDAKTDKSHLLRAITHYSFSVKCSALNRLP